MSTAPSFSVTVPPEKEININYSHDSVRAVIQIEAGQVRVTTDGYQVGPALGTESHNVAVYAGQRIVLTAVGGSSKVKVTLF